MADKLLEFSGNIVLGDQRQVLDDLAVERERGITVKARTASMMYKDHLINLIDTPGHVDFDYEVKRSLRSCQGALLLIDSTQGIQAQTLANFKSAKEVDLYIIPVLTKLDLPHSDPAKSLEQIKSAFGIDEDQVLWTSAKTGEGCDEILPAIIDRVPCPPPQNPIFETAKYGALVIDSWYDKYKGTIALISILHGKCSIGDPITSESMLRNRITTKFEVQELGVLTPGPVRQDHLRVGQVGYMICGVKETSDIHVGDMISNDSAAIKNVLTESALVLSQPKLFASIYPVDTGDFDELRKNLERLLLNDSAVSVMPESSGALGFGFRCGFLGKLHMEVFFQRLEDEFETEVMATAPAVPYTAVLKTGEVIIAETPALLPDPIRVEYYLEPMAQVTFVSPHQYMGEVLKICQERRGVQVHTEQLDENMLIMKFNLPWQEVIIDLHDTIKSSTAGYVSFDYTEIPHQKSHICKVDMMLNGKAVDALSFICHRSVAEHRGRQVALKLRKVIKRQQYEVIIQAAIGAKVLAKERIAPFRKDVLTKSGKTVGGGDQTRKMKLLNKQKEGKNRLKTVGNVQLDQKAFMSVLER